ncbi:flagellar protein FlgN [Amphibacillus sediminis]|uniref:flagellar protein FlgN n=1 Tax=Amphibacillus sediminis TaxID=360185 RepID=UPI00082E87B2|nr:flagellar protein FlgN [Amphibacillus sediminis]
MSITAIITSLDQLGELHKRLLHVSKEKTERLKKGDVTELQKLLKIEQKHVQAVQTVEAERIKAAEEWAHSEGYQPSEATVTFILERLDATNERDQLELAATKLAEILVELKAQEALNQELTTQSLQFIRMNLDLLTPSLNNLNYGSQNNQDDPKNKRSIFNSQA